MAIINLDVNAKNLVAGTGINLSSTATQVNLGLNSAGLAQVLSTILQSNSSVTVNYHSSTGTISFTSTANVTQGQIANLMAQILQNTGSIDVDFDSTNNEIALNVLSAPPPDSLVITNKNQFNSNSINVLVNQPIFLIATEDNNWDNDTTYTIVFPSSGRGFYPIFINYNLSINVDFITENTTAVYNLAAMSGYFVGVSSSATNSDVALYQGGSLYSP